MSYILDALKKAEQEREIGQVPSIASGHEQAAHSGTNRWLWVVAGVLVVNVFVLVIALWPQPDTKPVVVVPPVAAVTPPAPRPIVPVPPPVPQRRAPAVPVAPPVVTARPVETAPGTSTRPMTALRPLPPLSGPPPVTAAAVASIPANNLPVWPQVSGSLFQQINSSLHLDVHVYSDSPGERFVLINMRKYNEGEQLQEGLVVDAITPEDVILSFRGERFRVQPE